jgi:hypothetical protein
MREFSLDVIYCLDGKCLLHFGDWFCLQVEGSAELSIKSLALSTKADHKWPRYTRRVCKPE